ncbi:unnamed protein product [Umbelopsis ramanniana]
MPAHTVTPNNPPCPAYRASEKGSFAWDTSARRWPVILTSVIDDMCKSYAKETDETKVKEGKAIVEGISALKYEIEHDRPIRQLKEDGQPDVAVWNQQIATYFPNSTWFDGSWLYNECLMYRRLRELYNLSTTWKNHDPFLSQKNATFKGSFGAVFELAHKFSKPLDAQTEEENQILFHEPCRFVSGPRGHFGNLQATGKEKLEEQEKNIVVNDLDKVWNHVKGLKNARIDFVLDNAGFELFVDLVLADWLIQTKKAEKIVFHCKTIPWFVSDVIEDDFPILLESCFNPEFFASCSPSEDDVAALKALASRWQEFIKNGQWIITSDPFWCSGLAYRHLREEAPELFTDLANNSQLVFFKGDLNFRKLTYDCKWPVTTPFNTALGEDLSQHFTSICSLRTNKADVIVGLKEGVQEKIEQKATPLEWRCGGKYAVVEYSSGKPE